jgi:hypothetical protein
MVIRGSDLPPGITAERYLDGHHQERDTECHWRCDCGGSAGFDESKFSEALFT